jgi:glycosyltransferase involved in cell wall biosynthesis
MITQLLYEEITECAEKTMSNGATVHLVYPANEEKKSSPWSIGNNLSQALRKNFTVEVHDWSADYAIAPEPNDVLIGHPHPERKTVFRKSFGRSWARRYVICPFTTNPQQMYFVEPYVRQADAFFAICGPVWAGKLEKSSYSHLRSKFVHLDMAIDCADWSPLEKVFNPPGSRKFAFIGSSLALKGTPFLEHLAARRSKNEIGWIGASSWVKSNAECVEFLDLNSESGRKSLSHFDFVISPGRSDANPTVLLEAMSLGLIPICTKESGYDDPAHFYSLRYGNVSEAGILLDNLQSLATEELVLRQSQNFTFVKTYSWDRFTSTVCDKILRDLESQKATQAIAVDFKSKANQVVRSINSPYRRWRATGIIKVFENRFYLWNARVARRLTK